MVERLSAIADYDRDRRGRDAADGGRRVRLSEVQGGYLAQIDAFRGREERIAREITARLGIPSMVGLHRCLVTAEARLYGLTPWQTWWLARDEAPLRALAVALDASAGSVTLLSAARTHFAVAGSGARELLMRGIALDLDPAVFEVGCCALTGLHHTGVLLERSAEDRYELYVQRTYAASIWEWLLDAALPFGFDIGLDAPWD